MLWEQRRYLSFDAKLRHLTTRTLSLGCKWQSELAKFILNRLKIQSRIVACSSLELWNGQDDGHTLLEVTGDSGNIFVYDPSFRRMFPQNNILELCVNGVRNSKQMLLPGNQGNSGFRVKSYDYSFWVERRLLSEECLQEWYERVLQVPLILDGEHFVFPLLDSLSSSNKTSLSSLYRAIRPQFFKIGSIIIYENSTIIHRGIYCFIRNHFITYW